MFLGSKKAWNIVITSREKYTVWPAVSRASARRKPLWKSTVVDF